jgi:hypothetical protein
LYFAINLVNSYFGKYEMISEKINLPGSITFSLYSIKIECNEINPNDIEKLFDMALLLD